MTRKYFFVKKSLSNVENLMRCKSKCCECYDRYLRIRFYAYADMVLIIQIILILHSLLKKKSCSNIVFVCTVVYLFSTEDLYRNAFNLRFAIWILHFFPSLVLHIVYEDSKQLSWENWIESTGNIYQTEFIIKYRKHLDFIFEESKVGICLNMLQIGKPCWQWSWVIIKHGKVVCFVQISELSSFWKLA